MTLEEIYKESLEDFNLSVMNIAEKTREITAIKSKWLYRIVKEESMLQKMKELQQSMLQQLASFVRRSNSSIKMKTESLKQEELTKLSEQIKEQEECVKFLRLLLDNQIRTFTWDIKNSIEQLKLENT